jgi:hypothetical protein
VLPYRYDTIDVITTVRDWVRRFVRTAVDLARMLLAASVAAGWSGFELPVAPMARATAAVATLASAWQRRFGAVSPWRVAALVSGGSLLTPNTGSPLAPATASPVMAGTPPSTTGDDQWPLLTPPKNSPSGDTT